MTRTLPGRTTTWSGICARIRVRCALPSDHAGATAARGRRTPVALPAFFLCQLARRAFSSPAAAWAFSLVSASSGSPAAPPPLLAEQLDEGGRGPTRRETASSGASDETGPKTAFAMAWKSARECQRAQFAPPHAHSRTQRVLTAVRGHKVDGTEDELVDELLDRAGVRRRWHSDPDREPRAGLCPGLASAVRPSVVGAVAKLLVQCHCGPCC